MTSRNMFIGLSLAMLAATDASASEVQFPGADLGPATSWADGTFSSNVSGLNFGSGVDGFYGSDDLGTLGAFNGYGQSGESIYFNSPVTLDSLDLGECTYCFQAPTEYTVTLYGASDNELASQTITPTATAQLLTFDTADTKQITFTFTGGTDVYNVGDTNSAWYEVSNVTYNGATAIPEPAAWSLVLFGFCVIGAAVRSRRVGGFAKA